MNLIRLLAVAALLAAAPVARADFILSIPDGTARAGAPLRVELVILNDSDSPLRLDLPALLHARLETSGSVATLDLRPERSGALEVAPRQFLRVALQGDVPDTAARGRDADADRLGHESPGVADRSGAPLRHRADR